MKKNIFCCFLIVFCLLSNKSSHAQIQTFPPEGYEPSPYQLKLPGERFIPSTKRYNLVWADQLVPGWLTPNKVEFAAKNYIGTQKIWSNQVAEYRQYDPNFICTIYHLALGLNPQKNSDCPDPKSNSGDEYIGVVAPDGYVSEWDNYFLPWLSSNAIELNSTIYEDMFQHYDVFDNSHRVWHKDPYWLMDASDENWRQYLVETCNNWMEGNENEGCFFDVAVETNAFLYNPNIYNPEPTNFEWWLAPHKPYNSESAINNRNDFADWMNKMYLDYFQEIYRGFHRAVVDYLVIPNVDQMVTTVYNPTWMDGDDKGETIDGAMMEGFGNYTGYDMHLTLSRCIEHITGRGKIVIAQFYGAEQSERYRRTGMYMLVKNENSFINILNSDVDWFPEYEIDLGDQSKCPQSLEELRVSGNGWESLWKRDFENGMVLCNTSDAAVNYNLPEEQDWFIVRTSGGGQISDEGVIQAQSITYEEVVGEVSIGSSDCLILKSELKSSLVEREQSIQVYPNPFNDKINIELEAGSKVEINISNILGEILISKSYSKSKIIKPIDGSYLTSGIYFLDIFRDGRREVKIIFKK
jgi:hypothetical protein